MTAPLDLDAVRARLEKATPGRWAYDQCCDAASDDLCEDPTCPAVVLDDGFRLVDLTNAQAEFIAHAPEDVAALLQEVERLRYEHESEA